MADIFKNWYSKLAKQTQKYPMGLKIIIFGYCFALASVFMLIIILNSTGIFFPGEIDILIKPIDTLLKLFDRLTSPQMLAAVICAGKFFIDSDGNGIADNLEDNRKEFKV